MIHALQTTISRAVFLLSCALVLVFGSIGASEAAAEQKADRAETEPPDTPEAKPREKTRLERMASKDPAMFQGRTVETSEGETLGKVEKLVRDPVNQQIHAVVPMEGFLSSGTQRVVFSFDDLLKMDGTLVYMGLENRQEIQKQIYMPGDFEPVE